MTDTAAPPSSQRGLRVGEVVAGKYRLVSRLGEGGMGEVYEAEHVVMGRPFAIKLLHGNLARDPGALGRFEREVRTAGALESENIVAVLDVGFAADGTPFLLMERLRGEDLAHLLAHEGVLPVSRAVDVVLQACRGLHVVHARGIVHRDLKPENLFLCKRGDGTDLVKILDFGIAKLLGGEAAGPGTRTGATIGTPLYMSPEQARGEREIDHRADVYALGVVLYQCLSGELPHPGSSYNQILYHLLTKPVAPLESLRTGLPAGLAGVVHRAMAPEMDDRFASVAELVDALAPFGGWGAGAIDVQGMLSVARDARDGRREGAKQTPMAGTTTLPADHAGSTGGATSISGAPAAPLALGRDEWTRHRSVTTRLMVVVGAVLALTAVVVAFLPRRPVDTAPQAPPPVAPADAPPPFAPEPPREGSSTALVYKGPNAPPPAWQMPPAAEASLGEAAYGGRVAVSGLRDAGVSAVMRPAHPASRDAAARDGRAADDAGEEGPQLLNRP